MTEKKRKIFNLNFNAVTLREAAEMIISSAQNGEKGIIVTPNVDHIVIIERDREFKSIYNNALFVFADGTPIVWLSKLLPGKSLPERVTGADLLPKVCEFASKKGLKVLLMGGMQGVAEKAANELKNKYSGLNIVGTYSPPIGFEKKSKETKAMINYCNSLKPDIIFLGLGAPKQEKWASANLAKLPSGPILCIGAAIDFAAGNIKRSPIILQRIGLEWFWRLCREPRRLWKRYLIQDSKFIFLSLRELYRNYQMLLRK